eukprot:3168176-Lingulodinium_polyedra.AAC.1
MSCSKARPLGAALRASPRMTRCNSKSKSSIQPGRHQGRPATAPAARSAEVSDARHNGIQGRWEGT